MDLETRRKANKKERLKILKELGILREAYDPDHEKPPPKKRRIVKAKHSEGIVTPTRKSNRLLNIEPINYKYAAMNGFDENRESLKKQIGSERQNGAEAVKKPKVAKRVSVEEENRFGAIPGIPVGTHFATRLDACEAKIHRQTVAGIHSNKQGCYSIALSGGYEDDIDSGDSFIYTGSGGRDLKGTKANPKNLRTASQSKDQELTSHNLHLLKNIDERIPVRVLRGYQLGSKYAPPQGYRYDGLYRVIACFATTGKSGFKVYKYRFERLENQEPAPWS